MSEIAESALIDFTRELVGYESVNPPGNEGPLIDFLQERLDSSHVPFKVAVDEIEPGRSNLIARAGNPDDGTVLLTGHVDVVPAKPYKWTGDPFELRRDGDRLVGRGAADMKGALAAKVLAAETYLSSGNGGEVILAFVVGEESTGFGTESLVQADLDADMAILGEPTELQVAVAQKGTVRYTVTLKGRSAHSGRPDRGVNAVDGVRELLVGLDNLAAEVAGVEHPLLSPGSVTVTEVEGGTAPNVVPDRATLTVDWRSVPGADERTPEEYDTRLGAVVDAVERAVPGIEIDIDRWLFSRPAEVDPDSIAPKTVLSAARDLGIESLVTGFDATTDARHLIHAGIPTVLFGPGSIEVDAHTVDESVSVADLLVAARAYRRALEISLG